MLLDCGTGALHGLDACSVDWRRITHAVVSHFHYDHVGDLPALLFALKHGLASPRKEPLAVLGPPGLRVWLERLDRALGLGMLDQTFPVEIVDLAHGRTFSMDHALGMRCHPTRHTEESVAWILEGPWGAIAYTGDTGAWPPLAEALRGCRILIAECSHPDSAPMELHLTPRTLAQLAAAVDPELLVVTHVYPAHSPEEAVSGVRDRFAGRVVAGEDGLRVRVSPGSLAVDPPAAAV